MSIFQETKLDRVLSRMSPVEAAELRARYERMCRNAWTAMSMTVVSRSGACSSDGQALRGTIAEVAELTRLPAQHNPHVRRSRPARRDPAKTQKA